MLNYSFSTVLMAVLASNLIIITIAICFKSNKILLSVGYKLLAVFLIFTLIRFAFPFEIDEAFELGISRNVYLPEFLSIVIARFRQVLIKPFGIRISLWTIFEIAWLAGIICHAALYLRDLYKFEYFIVGWSEDVTEEEPYHSCLAEICGNRKNKFQILKLPGIISPSLYGISRPRILIPADMEITEKDLYYILRHEVSHHYHHDLVIKRIVSVLCMLYWWNPICFIFRKQVNTLLEMRIDDSLVQGNKETAQEYLSTLIHMAENSDSESEVSSDLTVSLSQQNTTSLVQRFGMVCNRNPHVNVLLSVVLSVVVIAMYLGSYLVTFEHRYVIEDEKLEEFSSYYDNIYAIRKDDGTYDIYYENLLIENVDSLDYHPGIPVYDGQ